MSTTTPFSSLPRDSEQDGLVQECEKLLSILPKERWYRASFLYKYKGFWIYSNQLQGIITSQIHFQAEDTDVFLITTPKSGTTWLKALTFTLLRRKDYPINKSHPLLHQNPHALVPFMELFISPDNYKGIPNLSFASGRLFSTHCPFTLLPNSVLSSDCKIVYLCRNIKDIFASLWNFMKKLGTETTFEEFFDMFCRGVSMDGPVWDHILDYWKESLEKPEKVLFLKFEAIKEEPGVHLKLLAEFMGCPISEEEETAGLVDEILTLCSFDNLSSLEVNKSGSWWRMGNHNFFRKGEVGDWKNHLTSEMAERLDQITAHKFHGSGLHL